MHPLSIIIAMGFLGMLLAIGAQLTVLSSRRLWGQYTPKLGLQAQDGRKAFRTALGTLLLVVGLFLLTQGARGLYRLFWVS